MTDSNSDTLVLQAVVTATDPQKTWWERRTACKKILGIVRDFNAWAETKYVQAMEGVGVCPCCPHPKPNGYESCAVEIFREGGWRRGGPEETITPATRYASKYAATLPRDQAMRFRYALRGHARITEEDYLSIKQTMDTAMQVGGWDKYLQTLETHDWVFEEASIAARETDYLMSCSEHEDFVEKYIENFKI